MLELLQRSKTKGIITAVIAIAAIIGAPTILNFMDSTASAEIAVNSEKIESNTNDITTLKQDTKEHSQLPGHLETTINLQHLQDGQTEMKDALKLILQEITNLKICTSLKNC